MSELQYLKLQPLEPNDDGTSTSPLDDQAQDETIDLTQDIDEMTLEKKWNDIVDDLETNSDSSPSDDK